MACVATLNRKACEYHDQNFMYGKPQNCKKRWPYVAVTVQYTRALYCNEQLKVTRTNAQPVDVKISQFTDYKHRSCNG